MPASCLCLIQSTIWIFTTKADNSFSAIAIDNKWCRPAVQSLKECLHNDKELTCIWFTFNRFWYDDDSTLSLIVNSHFRLCVWFRRQVWCSKRSTRQVCCWLGAPWENWEARIAEGLQGRIRGPVWPSEWSPRQVCRGLGPPGKTH